MRTTNAVKNLCKGVSCTIQAKRSALKPRWLWIGVTDRCNSRCEYCNIHQKKPIDKPLSPQEFEKVLSDPLFKDVTYLLNSGGEPTVRSDILEVLLAEHKALPSATIQLSTNGLLPERTLKVAEEMAAQKIKFEVGISIDGVGENHDRIRGVKGNFEKTDYLVKKLLEMKACVTLGATLTCKNLSANLEARAYAKALNIPFMFHWFNTSDFYGNNEVERQEVFKKKTEVENAIVDTLPSGLYREMWIKELHGDKPTFRCFALNTFAVLKCNGDVAPCLSLWDNIIGNLRDNSPTEIWLSQKAKDTRKSIQHCSGCLNSWGVSWSTATSYYPHLIYKTKNWRKHKI